MLRGLQFETLCVFLCDISFTDAMKMRKVPLVSTYLGVFRSFSGVAQVHDLTGLFLLPEWGSESVMHRIITVECR